MQEPENWAELLGPRCKAKLTENPSGFHGRCELKPHGPKEAHTMERGMVWVRWFSSPVIIELAR